MIDDFTLQHLRAWLANYVQDERREVCESAMLAFIADDPEYWTAQSWTTVYDRAECAYLSADSIAR